MGPAWNHKGAFEWSAEPLIRATDADINCLEPRWYMRPQGMAASDGDRFMASEYAGAWASVEQQQGQR
jgi:hypothetical protein